MLTTYYHATPYENLISILNNGIKKGIDGVVYLTKNRDEAMRFLLIRGCKDILTIEVLVDNERVVETFDHSQSFFKCRAFGYEDDIKPDGLINFYRYKL